MKIILLISGIIILLGFLLVFLPLRVIFEFDRKMRFKVFVYGIKMYDSAKDKDHRVAHKSAENDKKSDDNSMVESLKKKFDFLKEILKLIVEKAKKYAIIKNIEVKYRFGLGDAAVTGIFSGVVYSVVNGFAAFLRNHFKIKNQRLEVIPDFDNKVQEFEAKIELVVRVIFFVPVLLKVLKLFRKKKEV